MFDLWSTYLSDQLELELDAMRCLVSLSGSKCLPPFQVGHWLLYPPANQWKEKHRQVQTISKIWAWNCSSFRMCSFFSTMMNQPICKPAGEQDEGKFQNSNTFGLKKCSDMVKTVCVFKSVLCFEFFVNVCLKNKKTKDKKTLGLTNMVTSKTEIICLRTSCFYHFMLVYKLRLNQGQKS